MEQGFIDILKKVVTQHGKEYFMETKKCKAIISDYTGSEYRTERGLLIRAVEAEVSNAIITVEEKDLDNCMKVQQRKLQEEEFMDSAIAENVVNLLAHVLRNVALKENRPAGAGGGAKFDEAMGFYNDEQWDKAMQIFEALDKENHAGAQYMLGRIYKQGLDEANRNLTLGEQTIDYAKAAGFFRKAAEQGHAQSQSELGFCYIDGKGVAQDTIKGIEWVSKATEQGHANAPYMLGTRYDGGRGVTNDKAKADEWFRKAAKLYQEKADQGNTTAQIRLGHMYKHGQGVPQDYAKAAEWYRKAIEQGEGAGQRYLDSLKKEGKI
jgi:TPR repeat protein